MFAPGKEIVSAWKNDDTTLYYSTGTSMAAPHVSGVAALLLESCSTLSPARVKSTLVDRTIVDVISRAARSVNDSLTPNKLISAMDVSMTACPPGVPRDVRLVRSGSGAVTVSWATPNTNGGAEISAYRAIASSGGEFCVTATLSCTIAGLNNGSTYTVKVTASNIYGSSVSSSGTSIVAGTVPSSPGVPTAVVGDMNAVVAWTAPENGGFPITGYTVTANPGGATCNTTGVLTCTVAGLANGTNYTFSVVAANAIGASAASTASAAVMPAAAWVAGPTNIRTTTSSKTVTVTWSAAELSSGSPTGYVVRDKAGKTLCSAPGTATKCAVKNLKNGSSVVFSVYGVSVANESLAVATPKVVVGGLTQLANTMKKGKTYFLSSIAKTGSKGKMTWSRVSGSCSISGTSVKAPSKAGTCKLKASVAKSSPYPAQKMTFALTVK
jgi:hypothetical protein